jgi:hypothetical protein
VNGPGDCAGDDGFGFGHVNVAFLLSVRLWGRIYRTTVVVRLGTSVWMLAPFLQRVVFCFNGVAARRGLAPVCRETIGQVRPVPRPFYEQIKEGWV